MGVGKGYVLGASGLLDMSSFVKADPDAFKQEMPEFKCLVKIANKKANEGAASFVHKESGYIAELVQYRALSANRNLLIDGSLRDFKYHSDLFKKFDKNFPKFQIGIIHILADEKTRAERAGQRALSDKRVLPDYALTSSNEAMKTLTKLSQELNFIRFILTIDNNIKGHACIKSLKYRNTKHNQFTLRIHIDSA
jgi:hypothetical protein